MIKKIIFILVLFLGITLRVVNLNSLPPSLNWDEISLGYNAYSILHTARDEWGQFLPLSFKAYGDYKLPGYIYLDVPFIVLFGLNEWGVRLLSAVSGIGLIVVIYFLLKLVLKSELLALTGMFLTALTPWSLILSRIALEANLALFLTASGFFLLVWGITKKRFTLINLSAILFGLSIFTYNSSRVVTPLLLFFTLGFYFNQIKPFFKKMIPSICIFLLFFILAFPQAALQDSSARYKWTTILDQGAINQINEQQGRGGTLNKLTNNKLTYFIENASINYLSNFNPDFLFINGGSNYQFSVPGNGLLYFIYLPFLLVGIYFAFKEKGPFWLSVLSWLFIAPLPAAITRDSPHALRSLMMIPPLLMITALGVEKSLVLLKRFKAAGLTVFVLIVLLSFAYFWNNYNMYYPKEYSWSWQYGYQQVAKYIEENGKKYDKIYITKKYGEPHEFLLFYLKVDPKFYQQDHNLIRYRRSDWFWVDRFDKYYFINDWEIKDKLSKIDIEKALLVTSPGNFPESAKLIDSIKFLDNTDAFYLLEIGKQ